MNKKANQPQVTTQQTSQNQQTIMPEYVQAAQKNLLGTGQSVLAPYLSTPGYGVAGFNDDQNTAMGIVRNMATQPGAQEHATFTAADAAQLDPSAIQAFLNPYTKDVVDTTNQTLRDQNDITLNGIRARAAAGSAFGGSGSRAALLEASANKDLGNTIASTTAQLMAAGYDKATATAMANTQLQQQANLQNATQQNQFSQFDATATNDFRQQAVQALLGVGDKTQALEQQKLDVPLTALERLRALTPTQYGSSTTGSGTSTTTAPPPPSPSPLQQVLGAGLSIGGMSMGGPLAGTTLAGSLFGNLFKKAA